MPSDAFSRDTEVDSAMFFWLFKDALPHSHAAGAHTPQVLQRVAECRVLVVGAGGLGESPHASALHIQ